MGRWARRRAPGERLWPPRRRARTVGARAGASAAPLATTPLRPRMSTHGLPMMQGVLVGDHDPEAVALEAALRAAQLDADVAALDRLIADALLFTGPDGELGTKAQDLELHGSGAVRFRSHEPEELRVRRVGSDVMVCALRARLAVEVAGRLVRGTFRYTRVWAREHGTEWRVVGGHVSEVRPLASDAGAGRAARS